MNNIIKGIIFCVIGIIGFLWGFYTGRAVFLWIGGIFFLIGMGLVISGVIKKKTQSVAQVGKTSVTQISKNTDDTQFYVCPHCGGDTKTHYKKQYCDKCKIYL